MRYNRDMDAFNRFVAILLWLLLLIAGLYTAIAPFTALQQERLDCIRLTISRVPAEPF